MVSKKISFKIPPIKKTPVTRKFLEDLARSIYDSKSHRFLRLCNGKLQNGPDPTDKARPMHCGLGELYFAMTGHQPEWDHVGEDDVVQMALDRSSFKGGVEHARDAAKEAIRALEVSENVRENLLNCLDEQDVEDIDSRSTEFKEILDEIPNSNDDGCEDGTPSCNISVYRERSKRVAKKLREAAKLLPK